MSENKNAKTPADGPEYERGFVEGMQRQMQLHVNRVIREDPTAWLSTDCIGERYLCFTKPKDNDPVQPLYTTPQKREWVWLTVDEVYECWKTGDVVAAVEAKLKEKNT
jgi:hypothetical protein